MPDDRTIDMQGGFATNSVDFYTNAVNNPRVLNSLLHELGHARYLIDVYGFDVYHRFRGDSIAIRENDQLIVGTGFMPSRGQVVSDGISGERIYETPITGLMSTISSADSDHMDRYSAAAINLIAGHRATFGNCNEPENIGVFMNDLPAENRLTIRNVTRQIPPGADVQIYQSQPNGPLYGKFFDDVPDRLSQQMQTGRYY